MRYFVEAGGSDEFQGFVDYTFTRPDGTQLGTQGIHSVSWFIRSTSTDEGQSALRLDTDL
jgi:hypothetical protein